MHQSEKKLQQMLNRSFRYGLKIITITGYEIKDDRVWIHTNEGVNAYDRPLVDLGVFLKQLEPADAPPQEAAGDSMLANSISTVDVLRGVLLDNIEKVRADPKYIPQAQTITNNVNAIVNLTKLQLDVYKAAGKTKDE